MNEPNALCWPEHDFHRWSDGYHCVRCGAFHPFTYASNNTSDPPPEQQEKDRE